MDLIKISKICGIETNFIVTDEFDYDFDPKIYSSLLKKSNDLLAIEIEINNRINYRDHWASMVDGPLTMRREIILDILENIYGTTKVNSIVVYMRNKFKDKMWKPDNFFYYLEAALENNK